MRGIECTVRCAVALAVTAGITIAGATAAFASSDVAIPGVTARYDDPTNTFYLTDTACDGRGVSLTFSIDGGLSATIQNGGGCGTTTQTALTGAKEDLPLRWRACVGVTRYTDWILEDV